MYILLCRNKVKLNQQRIKILREGLFNSKRDRFSDGSRNLKEQVTIFKISAQMF